MPLRGMEINNNTNVCINVLYMDHKVVIKDKTNEE